MGSEMCIRDSFIVWWYLISFIVLAIVTAGARRRCARTAGRVTIPGPLIPSPPLLGAHISHRRLLLGGVEAPDHGRGPAREARAHARIRVVAQKARPLWDARVGKISQGADAVGLGHRGARALRDARLGSKRASRRARILAGATGHTARLLSICTARARRAHSLPIGLRISCAARMRPPLRAPSARHPADPCAA